MLEAAREETDHLAWCERRVRELDSRTSLLAPLWYAGSFAIGALAGLSGDRTSLGFVDETEKQVCAHLESHLDSLPADDERSRRIVAQMKDDEAATPPMPARRARRAPRPGARTDASHGAHHDPHRLSHLIRFRSKSLRAAEVYIKSFAALGLT